MVRVLVTGATGFVGRNLVRALLEKDCEVVILVRDETPSSRRKTALILFSQLAKQHKGKLTQIRGDIFDQHALETACQGVETVVHLVGIITEQKNATFERIHVDGTKQVVKVAKAAGVKHILFLSALGANPHTNLRYQLTKYEAELIVKQSGLDWTIFRPSVILGRDDQLANLFVKLFTFAPFVPVPPILKRARIQPVYIDDLVNCMIQSIEGKHRGAVHDVGGPQAISIAQFLDVVMRVSGTRRMTIPIPDSLFRAQAYVMALLMPALPFGPEQLRMLDGDNTCDAKKLSKLFGITLTPVEKALKSYL